MSDMRAVLSAARDAGDISLIEYLAELRKLRGRSSSIVGARSWLFCSMGAILDVCVS